MKIVFMGTPQFAVPILERLLQDGHEIAAVYTQPDKPVGRGYRLTPPPVKTLALSRGIPVFQPVKLRDGAVAAEIAAIQPDLCVVVAYGRLLPPAVLEASRLGCINLHASLLPRLRGAAPIQWAVLRGDETTGVTSMFMAEEMDTGDILLQHETPIGAQETAPQLFDRLAPMGAECISQTVALLEAGKAVRIPQDHEKATLAPMITKEMGLLDFTQDARTLHCQVRGLAGWPVAYTFLGGKLLKIHSCTVVPCTGTASGTITVAKDGLIVCCGRDALQLHDVQPEGSKRMDGAAFARGARLKTGEKCMNTRQIHESFNFIG